MTEKEWGKNSITVANEMSKFVEKFVTPVSEVIDHDYGKLVGSGSFFNRDGKIHLITNKHVEDDAKPHPLAVHFRGSGDTIQCTNEIVSEKYPIDVAVTEIPAGAWSRQGNQSHAIPIDLFEKMHSPVDRELLFFTGHSGDRSNFAFGILSSARTPYTSQEIQLPEDWGDEKYHFALPYPGERIMTVDGSPSSPPLPPGFSGSLVWNTRFLELGIENWKPSCARVTGLIWGWPPSATSLIATKIEHLGIL